jgi:hypothetical protein
MDLSIIEKLFALREEMEKAQLGVDVPDLAELERENDEELFKRLERLPDEKIAASLMVRALELDADADKWHEAARAPDQPSRREIVELLTAASAPLPMFDDMELTSVAVPPAPAEPIVTRAPSRPSRRAPEREPIRATAPRVADVPAKKSVRKAAKKRSKKPTRKPKKKPE